MIHDHVLKACDGLDGVVDGVLEDPTSCTVDFSALACKGADTPSCLTPAQIASARAITSPLTRPGSTEPIFPGYLTPGAELEWDVLGGPQPLRLSQTAVANIVYGDKAWNLAHVQPGHGAGSHRRLRSGRDEVQRPQPGAVLQSRREAADVARLGRSAGAAAAQHDLLLERAEDGRAERRRSRSPCS